jgi:hypothetical protein
LIGALVSYAHPQRPDVDRTETIVGGFAVLFLGVVITIGSYSAASSGGHYAITIGVFIAGLSAIARGLGMPKKGEEVFTNQDLADIAARTEQRAKRLAKCKECRVRFIAKSEIWRCPECKAKVHDERCRAEHEMTKHPQA